MSQKRKTLKVEELDQLQYDVTQKNATELPFKNKYWDNHEPGLYVDILTGEPLFSSISKYDSGCGWPSFTKPINQKEIHQKRDTSLGMERIEVRSEQSGIHLGHVFNDGPIKEGGLRYCINSAALRFIPLKDLAVEGYEEFIPIIKEKN